MNFPSAVMSELEGTVLVCICMVKGREISTRLRWYHEP